MKAYSKRTQKQMILNAYNELREEAVKEVSTEVMRQTAALFLYSMSIDADHPMTNDEIKHIYEVFLSTLDLPAPFGKQLDTDSFSKHIEDILGIDLNRINTKYELELKK